MKFHYFIRKDSPGSQVDYFYNPKEKLIFSEAGLEKNNFKSIHELNDMISGEKIKITSLGVLEHIGEVDLPDNQFNKIFNSLLLYEDLKKKETNAREIIAKEVRSLVKPTYRR